MSTKAASAVASIAFERMLRPPTRDVAFGKTLMGRSAYVGTFIGGRGRVHYVRSRRSERAGDGLEARHSRTKSDAGFIAMVEGGGFAAKHGLKIELLKIKSGST